MPNVVKISAKINTMQKYQHCAFCSFTVLNKLKLRYGPISDRTLLTLQLTSAESISRHVSVQMVDIWTLCEQTLANNLLFHVLLDQVASIHRVRFLLRWCLMVNRPTLLNCKALSLLRTVNEQKAKCCYFALIFMTFDRYLLDRWQKVTFETFCVQVKCKFMIFKFSKIMQQHT